MSIKIISKWEKDGKVCNLITLKGKGETKYCFTGWNPMPVKGWFHSSYSTLRKWMEDNGWTQLIFVSGSVVRFVP